MSTKQQTNSNNSTAFQFDPASLSAYHNALSSWMPQAQSFATNPYGNSQFNFESALGRDQAGRLGQRYTQNVMNNGAAAGYNGNMPGFQASMLNQAGRATGALQANAFRSAVGNANQRQMQSMGMLSSFQPLMTGSNSQGQQTTTTSGTGTWLPQILGATAGAGMNALTAGMSSADDAVDMSGQGNTGTIIPSGSSLQPPGLGVPGNSFNMSPISGITNSFGNGYPQYQPTGYGAYR